MGLTTKRKTIGIIASIILASTPFCSKEDDSVVARVGNSRITASELKSTMMLESSKYDPTVLAARQNLNEFRQQSLEKLIQERILLNEAKRLGVKADDADSKKAGGMQPAALNPEVQKKVLAERGLTEREWLDILKKRMTIEKLIQKEVFDRIPISEGDIEEYYRKHIHDFSQPTQFRARQILVDTKELAEEIASRLKKGEGFAELAKEHSLSPDSKRGGDLGYFDASSYPQVFSEICQKLKIGETSEVIATDYGYQIFELLDRRPPRQKTLDEAAPYIRRTLAEERASEAFKEWFENLKSNADIEIDKQALSQVEIGQKE